MLFAHLLDKFMLFCIFNRELDVPFMEFVCEITDYMMPFMTDWSPLVWFLQLNWFEY
jgi:hypothetical protein